MPFCPGACKSPLTRISIPQLKGRSFHGELLARVIHEYVLKTRYERLRETGLCELAAGVAALPPIATDPGHRNVALAGGFLVRHGAISYKTDTGNEQSAQALSYDQKALELRENKGILRKSEGKKSGAGHEVRTRDIQLGKLALCQLS